MIVQANGPLALKLNSFDGQGMQGNLPSRSHTLRENPMNFDFTDTDAIQRLLKARAYCAQMDIRINQATFVAFENARADYIHTVGIAHLFSSNVRPAGRYPG